MCKKEESKANTMQTMVDGLRISYINQGKTGIPILHLHGFGGEIDSFAPMISHWQGQSRRVLALDLPGFGQSDPPPEAWSVTEYAAFLYHFLQAVGVDRCDIIAHSFGARVAILLAAAHPECCQRIVFTGAAGLIPKRGIAYYWRTYTYKLGKQLGKIGWMNRLLGIETRQKKAGSSEYQQLTGTMRPTYVRVVNQNLRPYLHQIQSPTLLIWGSQDTATPLWMGKVMEADIPDAGLVVFEGCGHFAYLEEFPRFRSIVDEFLRR